MGDWDDSTYTAHYNKFSVGSDATGYTLTVGSFDRGASTLGDSMARSNGAKFSTKDVDNDTLVGGNCSTRNGSGGWWFKDCFNANPNGLNSRNVQWKGISWYHGGNRGRSGYSWKSAKFTITKTAD